MSHRSSMSVPSVGGPTHLHLRSLLSTGSQRMQRMPAWGCKSVLGGSWGFSDGTPKGEGQ